MSISLGDMKISQDFDQIHVKGSNKDHQMSIIHWNRQSTLNYNSSTVRVIAYHSPIHPTYIITSDRDSLSTIVQN